VNVDELRELFHLLAGSDISELELETRDTKLRLRRGGAAPAATAVVPVAAGPGSVHVPAPVVAEPRPSAAPPAPQDDAAGLVQVTSPIVGTFYRAADPNSPAFVNVGDRVKPGQVLCIVEAMKLMNEIEAETAGEIVKIHPENGQPVQYGDPLFTLRPDR
jgi:acetyl-CoA carboxylase biotin carboxyl carrier protein